MYHNEALRRACEAKFAGRQFCYHYTNDDGPPALLTIVVDGETGYYPLDEEVANGTENEMRQLADQLNHDHLHLSLDTVAAIILHSMQLGPRRAYGG